LELLGKKKSAEVRNGKRSKEEARVENKDESSVSEMRVWL
jgi:hypothetical protein